jgi:ABC-type amino acid transport substrate-binding protein
LISKGRRGENILLAALYKVQRSIRIRLIVILNERRVLIVSKVFLPLVAISCVLSLVCFKEGIAGTLQDARTRGSLIAGVRTDLPPFGFLDKNSVVKGIDIDIAKNLAKELFGKENAVKFVPVSSANGLDILNTKKLDILLGGIIITELHKEVIDYSIPYFMGGHLILAREDSTIARYQDLAGKQVAIILGSTGDIAIRELVPQARRVTFTDYSEAVQALKDRHVDALVDTNRVVIHFQRRNPKLKMAGFQPFWPVSYGVGVRKGDEEWLYFVNTALTKMKETGQYEKFLEKWFAEEMALLLGFEKAKTTNNIKNKEEEK